ncbi:hypothetical protein D1AOALGA4SA_8201 [Olavius algarvensis Delta 1 endosymbiont]|nr:hypothetical protein D1AOALGA4SA_8201 [Olavius algarvensis Delta 1 endosymbiont]
MHKGTAYGKTKGVRSSFLITISAFPIAQSFFQLVIFFHFFASQRQD